LHRLPATLLRRGLIVAALAASACGRIGFEPGFGDDEVGLETDAGPVVGTEILGDFVLADRSTYQAHAPSHAFPHSVSAGEDRILIVGAGVESSTRYTQSVTFGGEPLAKITSVFGLGDGLDCEASLWYMLDPPVGTHTLRVATQATKDLVGVALTIRGVDQTAPIAGADASGGEGNTSLLGLSPSPSELVIDLLCQGEGGDLVVGPGQIERVRIDHGAAALRSAMSTRDGDGTMSWSLTGSPAHAHVAALLRPAIR
jgi:hypothetical protein